MSASSTKPMPISRFSRTLFCNRANNLGLFSGSVEETSGVRALLTPIPKRKSTLKMALANVAPAKGTTPTRPTITLSATPTMIWPSWPNTTGVAKRMFFRRCSFKVTSCQMKPQGSCLSHWVM